MDLAIKETEKLYWKYILQDGLLKEKIIYARSFFINEMMPLLPVEWEKTGMEDMAFRGVMQKQLPGGVL